MIRNITVVFCFLSFFAQAQITISGTVKDSASGDNVPFATVYYALSDTTIAGTTSDINGNYSFKINQTGTYELISNFLYARDTIVAWLQIDTIINFILNRGIEYEQPCRKTITQNNLLLDIPTDKYEVEDYQRIKIETKEIGLSYMP